jgi:hypothetical protein
VRITQSQPRSGKSTPLDAALDYARRSWSIIPVFGKQPATLRKPFQQWRPEEHNDHACA